MDNNTIFEFCDLDFKKLYGFCAMNFSTISQICYSYSKKKSIIQTIFNAIKTIFKDFSSTQTIIALIINLILSLYYRYKIKKIDQHFNYHSELLEKFKKSFFVAFLIPFVLKLEVEAIYALVIMIGKNILDTYTDFKKNLNTDDITYNLLTNGNEENKQINQMNI